jgi:hemerythrin-like domain-containing protein
MGEDVTTTGEPLANASDMAVVHGMFRREFGLMPALVRGVAGDDLPRVKLVADHVALLCEVLETHHTGEDEHIWPRLRDRAPEDVAPLIGVMQDQHHAIHGHLAQVAGTLAAWRQAPTVESREALAQAAERQRPVMREHLALEEERVVPLIEQYITAAEYGAMVQEESRVYPEDKLLLAFGMVFYGAPPAITAGAVAHMPADVQPVIKDLGDKAYAAYATELYGTPTPRMPD